MEKLFSAIEKFIAFAHNSGKRYGKLNGTFDIFEYKTRTGKYSAPTRLYRDKNDVAENATSFAFVNQPIHCSEKKIFMKAKLFRSALLALVVIVSIIFMSATKSYANTINITANTNWSAITTGSGAGGAPSAADIITFTPGAAAITLTVDVANAVCGAITFPTNNAVSVTVSISNSNTLTISSSSGQTGILTIPRSANGAVNTFAVNAGTATVVSVAFTNGGGSQRHEITISTGTLTVAGNIDCTTSAGSATIDFTGAGTINVGGYFLTGTAGVGTTYGTLTAGTGTINFDGTVAQTIDNNQNGGFSNYVFANIQINNTSTGGATFAAAVSSANLTGNLSVQTGTLNNGGFAIALASGKSFSVASGANFNLTATTGMVTVSGGGTETFGSTSTVNFGGTAQAVAVESYGNLSLSGSGNKTFAGATTIAGTLAISGTAVALLPNSTTSTSAFLTLAGTSELGGSWGGTTSSALNQNGTYFGASTTGILNVTVGSCVTPTSYTVTGGGGYCSGGAGVAIGLSNSQTNVNYQLYNGSNPVGSAVAGSTGNPITFPNQTTAATYTVKAINTVGGCTANMTGSAVVTINPIPSYTVNGSTEITCFGSANGTITITPSGGTAPYTFSVNNGGSFISITANPGNPPLNYTYQGLSPNIAYKIMVRDANLCKSQTY